MGRQPVMRLGIIWKMAWLREVQLLCGYLGQRCAAYQRLNLLPQWNVSHRTFSVFPYHGFKFTGRLSSQTVLPFYQSRNYFAILNVIEQNASKIAPSLRNHQTLSPQPLTQVRHVVKYSKRGKRKTVKAVAKRFHRTGSGKLKYWPSGKVHNMLAKTRNRRRKLRKAKYVTKTQLKTLNKMISGW